MELFLEGVENEEFYRRYKGKYDIEIANLNSQIRNLERDIKGRQIFTAEELQQQVNMFFEKWSLATTLQEKNRLFSSMINKVWYDRDRESDKITISIEYL